MDDKSAGDKRDKQGQKEPLPSEDEVLRRMLNTPPKPHKATKKAGGQHKAGPPAPKPKPK